MDQSEAGRPAELHEDSTIPPRREGASTDSMTLTADIINKVANATTGAKRFGDYQLLNEVARGGMGVVYRAKQLGLNRIVALKMILDSQLATEDDVRRFYSEAQAAASLNHPHIVKVYDVGCVKQQHYFSMEFIEGESLAALVMRGPLEPRRAAEIMSVACEAAGVAHEQGIVHRDLKPANIILDQRGEPHITDFGLARRQDRVDPNEAGELLGTASYMPPEQAAGDLERIGPPSDVYALGATLYCLLVGRPPFQAATPADTLLQAIRQDPVPARQLNAQVPVDLETICAKCLEKSPARRYANSSELAADLRRFLNNEPILARPVSSWIELRKWTQRNPSLALVACVLSASIAALFAVSLMYNAQLRDEREAAVNAEARTVELLRLSETLLADIGQRKHAAAQSQFTRAVQLGRLCIAASKLALVENRERQPEVIELFVSEAAWFDADESPQVQERVAQLRRFATAWQSGRCPPEISDGVKLLTIACREDWRQRLEIDDETRASVERQAGARLAQTIELILASPSRVDAEPHIDRLLTTHRGLVEVLGIDSLAHSIEDVTKQLKLWSTGPHKVELRSALKELQRQALALG